MHVERVKVVKTLVRSNTRLRGHRDGLGFHAGLFRDREGDGGAGGAGGADAAGASLQQLLHVIQLSPCKTSGARTTLNATTPPINCVKYCTFYSTIFTEETNYTLGREP